MPNVTVDANEAYIAWAKETTSTFLYYATLTITPIGLLFNAIQIIVFSRKKFNNTTMGFFYIVSSFSRKLEFIGLFLENY